MSTENSELWRLLQGDVPQTATRELERLLEGDRFRHREGLTSHQVAVRSYDHARFLAKALRITAAEMMTDPRRLFALHESVSLVDGVACTALSIHYCLALGTLLIHGSNRGRLEPFIAELERMDSVGVFLATELGHGNDVAALETEAVYDQGRSEFSLSSPTPTSVKFMPNTGLAIPRLGIVMARLISRGEDHGVFPFLVRIRGKDGTPCPGITIAPLTEKPGYALDNAITAFDRVRVPKDHLLAGRDSVLHDDGRFESRLASRRQRFLAAMDRVQIGRVCFTSASASVLRGASWLCVRYTSQRLSSAPGKRRVPLLAYRNVQRDVLGGLATAYALTFAVRHLQRRFVARTSSDEREVFRLIAALKAVVTAEASDTLARLRERCGGVGLFSKNRILDYWNQLQGVITAEGDNQIMLLKVGRMLLDDVERSAVDPSLPPPGVLDPEHAVSLLWFREARMKTELKVSASESRRRTRDPFALWNDNVNGMLALAVAHGVRLVAQCFCGAIEDCRDEGARDLLRKLFSLWAIEKVEGNSGWFLARGCLSGEWLAKAARLRDELCTALESHAATLADSFGLTNALLAAPIASDDYVSAYLALLEPTKPVGTPARPLASHG